MKKLFLIFALGANAYLNAQGWIGNSVNNTLVPYNSNLSLTPLRVGIGTNSPVSLLDVNGASYFGIQRTPTDVLLSLSPDIMHVVAPTRIDSQTNLTSSTAMRLIRAGFTGRKHNPTVDFQIGSWRNTGTEASTRLTFRLGHGLTQNPEVNIMTLLSSGRVGIGTENPSEELHTINGVRFQGLQQSDTLSRMLVQDATGKLFWRRTSTIGSNGTFWSTLGNNNATNPGVGVNQNYIGTNTNNRLVFGTGNINGTVSERMTIMNNTGRVGLGINNPSEDIHVRKSNPGVGTTLFLENIDTTNRSYSGSIMRVGNQIGGAVWKYGVNGFDNTPNLPNSMGVVNFDNADLFLGANNIYHVWVKSTGRVGIGTNTPGGQFELSLDQGRKPSTNTWTITSDERLKNIHGAYVKGLNEILKLNPITYHYKNGSGREFSKEVLEQECIGFSAQEVKKIFPESVGVDEDGYLNLNIHAVLIAQVNAIKELNTKVEKQNNAVVENEELKAKIAVMEEKFALLEKTITALCENGCGGLKDIGARVPESSSGVDVLFQSIPNPTDSEALINYHLFREYRDASITVSSQDGKQLMSVKLDTKKGAGSVKINLGDLANGTYLYTLVAGEHVIDTKRLQIIK